MISILKMFEVRIFIHQIYSINKTFEINFFFLGYIYQIFLDFYDRFYPSKERKFLRIQISKNQWVNSQFLLSRR